MRSKFIEYNGETLNVSQWEEKLGMKSGTLKARLNNGWTIKDALELKVEKKHHMSTVPEYSVWKAIKARCYNKNAVNYEQYGGSGVTMYEPWKNSFEEWFAYVGPRPSPTHRIDRIKNEIGYYPGNLRWATVKESNINRCNTTIVDFREEKRVMYELCQEFNMKYSVVRKRICKLNWDVEKALTTPCQEENKRLKIKLTHNGETKTIKEWSEQTGISTINIWERIYKAGWNISDALTLPVTRKNNKKNTRLSNCNQIPQ